MIPGSFERRRMKDLALEFILEGEMSASSSLEQDLMVKITIPG
jgi:hypothetical protein